MFASLKKRRKLHINNQNIFMDEEISNSEKTTPLSFIPALGLLGLCIAVVAVVLGIFSMVKVSDTFAEMNDKIEKAAALSIDMKKMSDRIDSLALQIENLKSGDSSKVDDLAKQTQKAVESIGKILNENRAAIEENRKAIEEVAKRSFVRSPAPARESAQSVAAGAQSQTPNNAPSASAEGQRTHKIHSGDTFAKLALKYKVSVDAIIKANPDLNPSRLMIGQEVIIP